MANFAVSVEVSEACNENDGIEINIPNLGPIPILYQWLRDHCRCSECYNDNSNQRKLSILDFPANIRPEKYVLSEGVLTVTWQGGHRSRYQLSWLVDNVRFRGDVKKHKIARVPWMKLPDFSRVEVTSYLNTEAGLIDVVSSLLRYGVAVVTGVEATLAATEKIITRMAPVQKTFFGEMWEVIHDGENSIRDLSNSQDGVTNLHKDTAYTSIALGAHTDNTYWCDAAGLQVFHCLKPARRGGETLLVDGLSVSQQLKRDHPASYERLSQVPVSSTYIEDGQHHAHVDPILKLDPVTKDLLQIRFNLYDRSVLRTLPQSEIRQHYEDLRIMASTVADEKRENYMKLSPGEVLFIDNWRVMHGRAAYSGLRHLGGGYVARTDWRSRAAVLGLID